MAVGELSSRSRGRAPLFAGAIPLCVCAVSAAAVACGGDDVPVGGARGGAMAALVEPNGGNLPPAPEAGVSTADAASTPPVDASVPPGDAPSGASGPTWSYVFETYFKGTCLIPCHAQMTAPKPAYIYLRMNGLISGTSSAIAGPNSCLVWFGPNGNMPPGGTANPQAVADIEAWVAAGALDN
jgi:hypothetical protein